MKAYIGLGSNLGDRELNLNKAIELIKKDAGELIACSSFYYSEPVGFVSDNFFVNAALLITTNLQPEALLKVLQEIETSMGRISKTVDEAYSDRVIDLDILLYDDLQLDSPELKIPHPRMRERDFVMKPLRELPGIS